MGRRRRNRNRHQIDSFSSDEDSNDGRDFKSNGRQAGVTQLGSYAVTGRNRLNKPTPHQFQNCNTNQRLRERFQNRSNQLLNTGTDIPHSFNDNTFLSKSHRFKAQLLHSIDLTHQQIQQWYPDEDPSEDEMDWQPEAEIMLRQPVESVVDANPTGRMNAVSAWQPKAQKSSSPFDPASSEKAYMNLAPPSGPRVMRESLGDGFGARWDQTMKREMN